MKYMLLIYTDEQVLEAQSEEQRASIVGEYFAVADELRAADAYVAGAPLHTTETASTVRVRDHARLVTDGPFAETKEQLGGYFLIEAESDEEAREWAAKLPAARYGSVEVRPVRPVPARVG